MTDRKDLQRKAVKKRLPDMRHHVLVCVGGDCDDGRVVKRIKKSIAAARLRTEVSTAKVKCLGICKGGPIVIVYPDGTWYAGVTDAVADRIVDEHLRDGRPVEDHVFHRNPMAALAAPGASVR